jgi:predicted Zn-dependent protease
MGAANYVRLRRADPRGWIMWGNMLVSHAHYAEAERVLRQAMIRHPRAEPAIGWLLGRSLTNQDRLEEARELVTEQGACSPNPYCR